MVALAILDDPRPTRCAFCGGGIRWVRDRYGERWLALDGEPHPQGLYAVSRTSCRALLIPPEWWDRFDDEGTGRWRLHDTSCARAGRRVGDATTRWQSGDTRHAGQLPNPSLGRLLPDRRRPRASCDDCGGPVLWVRHRFDNTMVPIDAAPSVHGLLAFVDEDDLTNVTVEPIVHGMPDRRRHYSNHFTTCNAPAPSQRSIARAAKPWHRVLAPTVLAIQELSRASHEPRLTTAERLSVVCPACAAEPGHACIGTRTGAPLAWQHPERSAAARLA